MGVICLMPEHNINDAFWDDPEVMRLKMVPRMLFNYCMQSPRANLFGIYRLGFETIHKHLCLTRQQAIAAFVELSAKGFVHYDVEREVVWVVNRARFAARSPRHWLGIGRVLECLYKSPLVGHFIRYYHQRLIGRGKQRFCALDDGAAAELTELSGPLPNQPLYRWLKEQADPSHRLSTGQVTEPQMSLLGYREPQLSEFSSGQSYPTGTHVEVDVEEKLSTDSRTSNKNSLSAGAHARSNDDANLTSITEAVTHIEACQTGRLEADKAVSPTAPPGPEPPPPPEPPPHNLAITRLWSEQEAARSAIRAEGIDPTTRAFGLVPGHTHLAAVKARVDEHGEEACRYVLACFAAEARAKGTLRYFNGTTNWDPVRFARMLGSSPELEAKRSERSAKRGPPANPYAGVVERLADGSTRTL